MSSTYSTSLKRVLAATVLLLLAYFYLGFFHQSKQVPPRKPFSEFPKKIGNWVGTVSHFDKQVYEILGVDDSILIDYRNPAGKDIGLYVGYYTSQREGAQIHSPKHCLPGSGWDITQTTTENLDLGTKTVKVAKLLVKKGGSTDVMLYWFSSRGRFIASEYWQRIFMVWDSITKDRTDEAFVRLTASVPAGGTEAQTTKELKKFAVTLVPILNQYIPGPSTNR